MAKRGEIFDVAPVTTPNGSSFDMSNENLLSCGAGTIVPHNVIECISGDKIKGRSHVFGRVSPLLSPTFGRVDIMNYDFYVRYRDIWPDFDEFITNQDQDKAVINSSFVAPVPPSVPVLDLLCPAATMKLESRHPLNYNSADPFNPLDTGGAVPVAGLLNPIFPVLHIQFDSTGILDANTPFLMELLYPYEYWPDTTSSNTFDVFITLLPGRKDYQHLLDYFNRIGSVSATYLSDTKEYYNYLSNGDLCELMGLNIDAFSIKQLRVNLQSIVVCIQDSRLISSTAPMFDSFFTYHFDEILAAVGSRVIFDVSFGFNGGPEVSLGYNGYAAVPSTLWAPQSASVQTAVITSIQEAIESVDDEVVLLPVMAYNFIYDEYFRDQNYIDKSCTKAIATGVITNIGSQLRSIIDPYFEALFDFFTLRRKSYMHDPYTSGLPSAQRGEPVRFLSDASLSVKSVDNHLVSNRQAMSIGFTGDGVVVPSSTGSPSNVYSNVDLVVDLSAATVENFRWANAMQRYLEAVNRTGGRYYEYMWGIFGKEIPDSKINRPIYLNGNRIPLQISEVLQTSSTDTQTDQALGDMAGRGVVVGSDDYIEYDIPDHGVFIQLSVVVPRTSYMSGLNPMFKRFSYLDYPIPQFSQLGEEYVRTSDLWYDGTSAIYEKPFAYQSRYWQWKYRRDEVHSDFKDTLDFWHWSRKFSHEPVMGKEFLEINPDYRQFAYVGADFDHFYLYFDHSYEMYRVLPTFGVPSL